MTRQDDSRKPDRMKRDMNLIRSLQLLIEEQGSDTNRWIDPIVVEGYTEQQISHHVWLLADGGYIRAIDLSTASGSCYRPRCLTWRGYELLGDIRDRDVWESTLSIAKRGGVASVAAIAEIAKRLAQRKLEQLLVLPS